MEGQEQNKTEEATPFKLQKAREKGQVARGMDLGFVGSLIAVIIFFMILGETYINSLEDLMRISFSTGMDNTEEPSQAFAILKFTYWSAFKPLLILGGTIMAVIIFLEFLQLRGFIFTTHPLKLDFSKLNPAKGLKRIFSMKMLKETLKNIFKMILYTTTAWFMINSAIEIYKDNINDVDSLSLIMVASSKKLIFAFLGLAFLFMILDQIIVRKEFKKQMRMSRSELTRENKDREGEPRFKQKRKQLFEEMQEQSEGLGKIQGSDFLITNPEHYAVAIHYDSNKMKAPVMRAKGHNHYAQLMKRKARLLSIPIIPNPPLARAIYHNCQKGHEVRQEYYNDLAKLYLLMQISAKTKTSQGENNISDNGKFDEKFISK